MSTDLIKLALDGNNLSDAEARKLESALQRDTQNMEIRVKLLGYYLLRQFQSQQMRRKRQQHVLWLIRNRPAHPFLQNGFVTLEPVFDGAAYKQGRELWLQHVKANPKNVQVLTNAVSYLSVNDTDTAIRIAQQLLRLQPDNPDAYSRLAHLYSLRSLDPNLSSEEKVRYRMLGLSTLETGIRKAGGNLSKHADLLGEAAALAYQAGNMARAEQYAKQVLQLPSGDDEVHVAHNVLGLIALHRGDVAAAKQRLIEAGSVSSTPSLSSFGPDFTLAKLLLEKGEREVVLQYIDLVERFWDSGKDRLAHWRQQIRQGRHPNFGQRLGLGD